MATSPHLSPWRRERYNLARVGLLVALAGWLAVAITILATGYEGPGAGALAFAAAAFVAITGPAVVWMRLGMIRARSTAARNEDALVALREGRYADAAEIFEGICRRARHAPWLHVIYLFNLGMAWLALGQPDRARAAIERARATGWFASPGLAHLRPSVEIGSALCLAVSGELEAAERALSAASLAPDRRATNMLVAAVIAVRQGRDVELDAEALRRAEACLSASHVRALRLLQAFSRARALGGAYREGADEALDAIGIRPGELDFLSVRWPELRAFMAPRGLLAASATSPNG